MNTLPPAVAALETRLGITPGALADEDLARATAALEDATTLALVEVPASVAERWQDAGAPDAAALVILKAARREFDNPRGIQQETYGEHTVGLAETSGVYLTAREVRQLRRAATGRPTGFVGSIRTPAAYDFPQVKRP